MHLYLHTCTCFEDEARRSLYECVILFCLEEEWCRVASAYANSGIFSGLSCTKSNINDA